MADQTIQQMFDLALQHHQAGRLQEAERLYRQVLTEQPEHVVAIHHLGLIARQTGRNDIAVDLIRRAIALSPGDADAHSNLGNALKDNGQLDEAIAAYRHAILLRPGFAEVHSNLGIALKNRGQLDEAIAVYRQAIALKPNYAEAHNNLGVALRDKGQLSEAIAAGRQAISLKPNFPQAHSNLANALKDSGQLDEAIAAYRCAIALSPNHLEAHVNLGNALTDKGQLDEAIAAFRRVVALRPDDADAHYNLGVAMKAQGQLDEAIVAYRRAIFLKPRFAEAHNNLAIALRDRGELDEAIVVVRHAIALNPDLPEARVTLGSILKDKGQLDDAIAAYREAIALRPNYAEAFSNLLYAHYFDPRCSQAQLLAEHRAWAERHANPLKRLIRLHANDRDPNRRLRVGYVSPDFRDHPVGRFLLPLLTVHDRGQFEIYCYSDVKSPDSFTARLRGRADVWRTSARMSDEQLAEQIRGDRIDILVDLTLHTAQNRLLVFARKPAPIQVTYLGYPGTTGLETIDYRITDPHLDPPDSSDAFYTEHSIRLPQSYWCYEPPIDQLDLTPLPAATHGFVTFGCLNNFCKVSAAAVECWCRILAIVPDSRLLLHAFLGGHRDAVRQKLSDFGIDPGRLGFAGKVPLRQYMREYDNIDIGLDPFPYVGGTTTCDALWMGVPVVTLRGQTAISRGGTSILANVGIPELIANSPDEYVRVAAELSADLSRLTHLRINLRQKMRGSPLMDAPGFARNMEAAYRTMWTTYLSPH